MADIQDLETRQAETPSDVPVIEVRQDPTCQGLGVFAARLIQKGERLGTFTGNITRERSRMSLQFGPDFFVEPDEEEPLRNLNHACEPSAVFTGRELVAARNLEIGAAITIDYNAYEDTLSSPFLCACGAERCVGWVRGRGFGR